MKPADPNRAWKASPEHLFSSFQSVVCVSELPESPGPPSSAGNQVKHMDILKGSIWQIVLEKMLVCGKALALPSTGNNSVVWWWGDEAAGSRGVLKRASMCVRIHSGCFGST